jgi:hypothetical protein
LCLAGIYHKHQRPSVGNHSPPRARLFALQFPLSASCIHTLAEMDNPITPFPRGHALRSGAYSGIGHAGGDWIRVMPSLRRTISNFDITPYQPSGSCAHLLRSPHQNRAGRICCPRVAHAACNPQGLGNTPWSVAHRQPTARPRSYLLRISPGTVSVLVAPASPSASQRSSRDLGAARVIGVHSTCSLANRLQRRTTTHHNALRHTIWRLLHLPASRKVSSRASDQPNMSNGARHDCTSSADSI